jgi:hypothetical protein
LFIQFFLGCHPFFSLQYVCLPFLSLESVHKFPCAICCVSCIFATRVSLSSLIRTVIGLQSCRFSDTNWQVRSNSVQIWLDFVHFPLS